MFVPPPPHTSLQGGEAKADAVAAAPAPAALPPAPKLTAATTSDGGDEKARAGLFAALNQGGGVTSGQYNLSSSITYMYMTFVVGILVLPRECSLPM